MNKQHDNRQQLELAIAAGTNEQEAETIHADRDFVKALFAEEELLKKAYAQRHKQTARPPATSWFYMLWVAASLLATTLVLASLRPGAEDARTIPLHAPVHLAGGEEEAVIVFEISKTLQKLGEDALRAMLREDLSKDRFDAGEWKFEQQLFKLQTQDKALEGDVRALLDAYEDEAGVVVAIECRMFETTYELCNDEKSDAAVAKVMKAGCAYLDPEQVDDFLQWIDRNKVATVVAPKLTAYYRQRCSISMHDETPYIKSYVMKAVEEAVMLDPVIEQAQSGHCFIVRCKPAGRDSLLAELRYEESVIKNTDTKRIISEAQWAENAAIQIPVMDNIGLDYELTVPSGKVVLIQCPVADPDKAKTTARLILLQMAVISEWNEVTPD